MLTNNYHKLVRAQQFSNTIPAALRDSDGVSRDAYTSQSYFELPSSASALQAKYSTGSTPSFILGDGDAQPALTDYKLSGELITDVVATVAYNHANDGSSYSALITLTNNNDTAITIREIGIICAGYYAANMYKGFLCERSLLETPLTIEAGGVGQITYTIHMPFPA